MSNWLLLTDESSTVAPVAPRTFSGNMCGVRVPGLPPVNGGGPDDLVLSWFYPRYPQDADRARIRAAWKARGYLDVTTSWQDDASTGMSYEQIIESRQELCADGFRPCEMLASKYYSPSNDAPGTLGLVRPMLDRMVAADCISRYCVGWELNLFNSYTSLQALIDAFSAVVRRPLYVHFSAGYADWRPDHPGSTFAEFWNAQVGKLTGLLHQIDVSWDDALMQARITDVLSRFAGNYGVAPDSGFGHPFDYIALEVSAISQFNGSCSEAEGDRRGRVAIQTPPASGPAGVVSVLGSGNGN